MSERGHPVVDRPGAAIVEELVRDIEEEERLSRALGVDLAPADPLPSHAPRVYGPLAAWLERSLEVHSFLERTRIARGSGRE